MKRVEEVDPESAWKALESDPNAVLIDVRTRAEWSFVGIPDLGGLGKQTVLMEWQRFPDMTVNEEFASEAIKAIPAEATSLYFICRSGARSMKAAMATLSMLTDSGRDVACINVAEGFEGDLDEGGHRGRVNGWKARNLTWRQN